jgi:hypothetical protein
MTDPLHDITHVSLGKNHTLTLWLRGDLLAGRRLSIRPVLDDRRRLMGLTVTGPYPKGALVQRRFSDRAHPPYATAIQQMNTLLGIEAFGKTVALTAPEGSLGEGLKWEVLLPDERVAALVDHQSFTTAPSAPALLLPAPVVARVAGLAEAVAFVRESNARAEELGLVGIVKTTKAGRFILDGVMA